jgi:hypothetical protein
MEKVENRIRYFLKKNPQGDFNCEEIETILKTDEEIIDETAKALKKWEDIENCRVS